jgi:hypothetical protein
MNVNRELKIVWWAPERCGTKITAEIFRKFDFEIYNPINKEFTPLTEKYHSHTIDLPDEFKDYKIICNVRNPYDKILSFYLNFTSVGRHFVYLKNKKEELKNKIDTFTLELFEYAINQRILENKIDKIPVRDYVAKLNFDGIIPQNLIRMENLVDDLSQLEFITESSYWKSGEIIDLISNNKFYNKKPFEFTDLYSFQSASRVYNYYKKHFFICDYDPFSFTKENLSEEQKFKFIHAIL